METSYDHLVNATFFQPNLRSSPTNEERNTKKVYSLSNATFTKQLFYLRYIYVSCCSSTNDDDVI